MRVHRFTLRRSLAALATTCVLAGPLTVGLAGAQDAGGVGDLRQEREDNRRDAADVAAELDALSAEDDELAAAIEALDSFISLQEAKVAAAEEAIADAEERARLAREEAEALSVDMAEIRDQLELAAIDAFVAPRPDVLGQLDSENLLDVELKQSYVEDVVGDEYELIDLLRVAQSQQDEAIQRADEATEDAEAERVNLAEGLVELDESRAEVEVLRAQNAARVAEWEAVGAEIEAADAAIEAQIRELEAELARQAAAEADAREAEEEAARLAAEEDAADADGDDDDSAAEEDDTPPADLGPFVVTHRPVPGVITSSFGSRVHPIFGTSRNHYGIDFNGNTGDPIVAAASGKVISAGWMNGYGNVVVISHGDGFTTLYAHQSELLVGAGESVSGGDTIGRVGSTGFSTGAHLHWEIRVEGVAVNPANYL